MIVVDRLGNVITNGEKQNNLLEKEWIIRKMEK